MSVLETVTTLLPPPQFLQMTALGVDISDSSMKYVLFQPDKMLGRQLQLRQWGDVPIPDNVLHRGVVKDVPALGHVLADIKKITKASLVRVSLPEERAYVFETEIATDTKPSEIRGLLEFRLEENVPLSPRDAYFDYDIVPSSVERDKLHVLVTVYARETINNYFEACQMAGLQPLSFEVEAQAIARSVLAESDPRTHMIIDFGKTRSGIGIVSQGMLLYTSTIDIGGVDLSASMRSYLGDLEEKELTELKNTYGILPSRERPEIRTSLQPVVNRVVEEVATRLDYWNQRSTDREVRNIHTIQLCGGSANMRGLTSYMAEQTGIETMRSNVWKNVAAKPNWIPDIDVRHSYGYATAIGLALSSHL